MSTNAKWVAGRMVTYETGYRHRWIDAVGPDVVKWELLANEPESANVLMRYNEVADSSGTVQNYTVAPYIVRNDTHALANKSAGIQLAAVPFKFEASMPLYFGIEFKLANATSVGLNVGLFQNKSGDLLTSSGVVQSSVGGAYFISAKGATTLTPTTATASGAATSTTSTTTIGTAVQTLEILWDVDYGSSGGLHFYANGSHLGTLTSSICSSLALAPGWTIQGNNKQMDVKWARCIQLRT